MSSTIHRSVTHNLPRGPTGRCVLVTLHEIFSLLIFNVLPLEGTPLNTTGVLRGMLAAKSRPPYSFTFEDAIKAMQDLLLSIRRGCMEEVINYKLAPKLSHELLHQFFGAHLLHCPQDKTRSRPALGVFLQPTPKGIAILEAFSNHHAIPKADQHEILLLGFNTMSIFQLERSDKTDRVCISASLIELLLESCMGPKRNTWSCSSRPMRQFKQSEDDMDEEDLFFDNFAFEDLSLVSNPSRLQSLDAQVTNPKPSKEIRLRSRDLERTKKDPPSSHRFFTNPDSTAHSQYPSSEEGVRMYHDRKLPDGSTVEYCFSGKALCQWIMDCTDAVSPFEAHIFGKVFIKSQFIYSITGDNGFKAGKSDLYYLTPKGLSICKWGNDPRRLSFATLRATLEDVLYDHSLRRHFRSYLEREHCVENFDAYFMITGFTHRMKALKRRLEANEEKISGIWKSPPSKEVRSCIRLASSCLSTAFRIFSTFVAKLSPHEVNIEYTLRQQITHSLTQFRVSLIDAGLDIHKASNLGESELVTISSDENIPEKTELRSYLAVLNDVSPLFLRLSKILYYMMETSSLPYFLADLQQA